MSTPLIMPSGDVRATALAIACQLVSLNPDKYRPYKTEEELAEKMATTIAAAAKILLNAVYAPE